MNFEPVNYKKKVEYLHTFDSESLCVERYTVGVPKNKLLVVHGIGGDSNAALPFVKDLIRLSDNFECIVYDLRGHGYSTKHLGTEKDIETIHAKDLLHIISLEKTPLNILGSSFGALVLYKAVELNPDFPRKKLFFASMNYRILPFSVNRRVWFSLLKKLKKIDKNSKRSMEKHLSYQHTHDFSPRRVTSDVLSFGPVLFFLSYFSIFGWKSSNPQALNSPNNYLFYGKNDLVFPRKQQEKWLKTMPFMKSRMFSTNHNILVNLHTKLAQVIFDELSN